MATARNVFTQSEPRQKRVKPNAQVKPKAPVWDGAEYPRYLPGIYDVRCNHIQGPEWLRNYRRWSIRLECNFLTEEGAVSGFLNLGDDPDRPHVRRGFIYFKVWSMANGGLPRRGQRMEPDAFLGKFFRVKVEDAKDIHGNPLPEAERYSKIVEFLDCIGP